MIAADLARAALLLLLLLVRSAGDVWLIYLVALLQTSIALFFQPAESALVPHLVGEDQLLPANSLIALNWELTRLLAPPLGGLLMALYGIGSVVALDSASFLLSAIMLALLALPAGPGAEQHQAQADVASIWRSVWDELAAGISLVKRDRLIAAIFIITGTAMISEGLINVLGFPWLKQVLHGGAIERGWLASAQAIGGLLGGLLIGRAGRALRPIALIGWSGALLGVLSLAQFNVTAFPIDAALVFPLTLALKALIGLPIMGMFVSLDTLLQQNVADRYRGRIFGAYGALSAFSMVIGQVLASLLGDRAGIVPMLDVMAFLYLVAGALALLLPRGQAASEFAPCYAKPAEAGYTNDTQFSSQRS